MFPLSRIVSSIETTAFQFKLFELRKQSKRQETIQQDLGVVHAYVDQKLLKSNKIKSFNRGPKIGSRHCSNEYKRTRITTPAYAIVSLRPPKYNIYLP